MTIHFQQELLIKIPLIRLVLISADVKCLPSSDELNMLTDETVKDFIGHYRLDEISQIEGIASARKAYRSIGNDPNRYRPSAESLSRRVVKGYGLYKINNVVDILNLISLQSGFSIGGYDANKIQGEISLGVGREHELYTGIGKGNLNISCLPVLRDDLCAFGTPTSDSKRTMITDLTSRILFVFFDFGFSSKLDESVRNCEILLSRFCSAKKTAIHILVSK